MTHEELFDKYVEIMSEDGVVEAFKTVQNTEEARAFFRDRGMEATDEELDGILEAMAEYSKKPLQSEDELSEKEMEMVSGGGVLGFFYRCAKYTWEAGTWIAGKLVYGSQAKAKEETIKYWKNKFGF